MSDAFSFGSYYPGEGPLYDLDPRTKLLGGFLFLAVCLLAGSFSSLAVIAAFCAALYALSGVPAGRALRSLAPLLAIVALVAVLNLFANQGGETLLQAGPVRITGAGAYRAAFVGARMLLMMCSMSLVTMTTMALDLTHAVEWTLAPLARLGFPAHEVGMMLGLALRFMPQLASELRVTHRAQVSRGARAGRGPVGAVRMLLSMIVPLIASVFRHSETLSSAMDARCYHGERGRTRLHPLRFGARDAAAAVALAVLGAAVVAVGSFGWM